MNASISDIPKTRGRPPTGGRKAGILVRVEPSQLAALDAWIEAQPDAPSRPEAVRRILASVLK